MDYVIQKFFALHHYLILPGIGNFETVTQPAGLDFVNRNITFSKNNIVFNTQPLTPTQAFYNFLAHELHTNATQAIGKFEDYTKQLLQRLTQQNSISFKTIGTLTSQQNDELIFTPAETLPYFPALAAERIIRKNVAHTVLVGEQEKSSEEMQVVLNEPAIIKKERWWIAASILAFIGIAAIVFYYASH